MTLKKNTATGTVGYKL